MPYAAEILLPLAQNISLFVVFAVAFAGVRRRLGRPLVFRTQVVSGVIFPDRTEAGAPNRRPGEGLIEARPSGLCRTV